MTWHLAIGLLIKTHETEQSDFRRVIIFASASSDSALHWNNILYLTFLLPSQPLSHSPHRPLSRSMCYFLIYIYIFIQVSFHSLSLFMLYYFFTSLKLKALYIFVYLKVLCSCDTIPSSTSFYFCLLFFFETHFFKLEDFLFCFFGFLFKTQFSVYICA